jgi:HAMP domain-containing protein
VSRKVLLVPALFGLLAGAALTFATFWLLQAIGPVERAEAVVVARDSSRSGSKLTRHLVLRTASGERFEAWSSDGNFDAWPGRPVRLEISEAGRTVRAVEVDGHRVAVDTGGVMVFWATLFGGGMLVGALAGAAESGRPVAAAVTTAASLGTGVLPVSLLF